MCVTGHDLKSGSKSVKDFSTVTKRNTDKPRLIIFLL